LKVWLSFASSSVSSAVISFVVEPIERSLSAWRAHATVPVETSITIALGALTESGQSGAFAACAGVARRQERRRAARAPAFTRSA
jgi:hypothetical protein